MPTLLLSPRYGDDSIRLRRAALSIGWNVERIVDWRCPEDFQPEEPVLYGEPLFVEAAAESLGIQVIEPPEDLLVHLPERYVRRRIRMMTAREARLWPTPAFFKPPNIKLFAAGICNRGEDLPDMPEDDPVLVAEPVRWVAEFRLFVRERRVHAWSPYWLHGRSAREGDDWIIDEAAAADALDLANQALGDPTLEWPRAFVLDVGIIADAGPAIVEANCAAMAGLYNCDPLQVLEVVRATAMPQPYPQPQPTGRS